MILRMVLAGWGVALAGCATTPDHYHPVAVAHTPDGYSLKAVLQRTHTREECEQAVRQFTSSIVKGCAACRIDDSRCIPTLSGEERALAGPDPVPGYVVETAGVRMLISGPEPTARAACEQIAANSVRLGVKTAACVHY